jgi:hypothetical protein
LPDKQTENGPFRTDSIALPSQLLPDAPVWLLTPAYSLRALVPSEAEHFGIAHLLEALGAGGGATAGDDGEGLLGRSRSRSICFSGCIEGFGKRSLRKLQEICSNQTG